LKILHCIPSLRGGGAERQLMLLSREQRARGHDSHIAYLSGDPETSSGVSFHMINASGNHDPRIVLEIIRLAREIRPDVIQTWLPQMDVAGGIAARITSTPWLISERSSSLAYEKRLKDTFLRRRIGHLADGAAANSEQGSLVWKGALRRNAPAHVVFNAIDMAAIEAAPVATNESLGVNASDKVVMFAGRLSEEKGIEPAIAAAEIICDRPNTAFVICGEGVLQQRVQRVIDASRNREGIRYLGYRDDIFSVMKRSSVLLSTSRFEGNPNAVIEALACGTALVVSEIPAHREFLDDTMASFVSINPEQCAKAVIALLDDDAKRERQVNAARIAAASRRPEKIAAAYDVIYRDVISRRRGVPALAEVT